MADAAKLLVPPFRVVQDEEGFWVESDKGQCGTPISGPSRDERRAHQLAAELNAALGKPVVNIEALAREMAIKILSPDFFDESDIRKTAHRTTLNEDQVKAGRDEMFSKIVDDLCTILRTHLADSKMRKALIALRTRVKSLKAEGPLGATAYEILSSDIDQALDPAGKEGSDGQIETV